MLADVLMALLIFLLGTAVGSFLNVVALRYGSRSLGGRSQCPTCHRQLRWWELVPLGSFMALRGRCWRCAGKVSVQYPLVELAMGLLFLIIFLPRPLLPPQWLQVILTAAIVSWLVVLFLIDLRTFLLPDQYIVGLLVTVVCLLLVGGGFHRGLISWGLGLLCGSGFFLLVWLLTRGRGLGLGDVKLLVPLGLLLGGKGIVVMVWLTFMAGGVVSLWLLARQRVTLKTAVPFGPFLVAAAIVVILVPEVVDYLFSLWL